MENKTETFAGWNSTKCLYPKECHEWIEDTTNYYKTIISEIEPYIEDFLEVLRGEGAKSYYGRGKVRDIKELKDVLYFIKNETYGRK